MNGAYRRVSASILIGLGSYAAFLWLMAPGITEETLCDVALIPSCVVSQPYVTHIDPSGLAVFIAATALGLVVLIGPLLERGGLAVWVRVAACAAFLACGALLVAFLPVHGLMAILVGFMGTRLNTRASEPRMHVTAATLTLSIIGVAAIVLP